MNQKQKCFYTALGALIMLFGLGAGALLGPPLIAQRKNVLDDLKCSSLTVVDAFGNPAIV